MFGCDGFAAHAAAAFEVADSKSTLINMSRIPFQKMGSLTLAFSIPFLKFPAVYYSSPHEARFRRFGVKIPIQHWPGRDFGAIFWPVPLEIRQSGDIGFQNFGSSFMEGCCF